MTHRHTQCNGKALSYASLLHRTVKRVTVDLGAEWIRNALRYNGTRLRAGKKADKQTERRLRPRQVARSEDYPSTVCRIGLKTLASTPGAVLRPPGKRWKQAERGSSG